MKVGHRLGPHTLLLWVLCNCSGWLGLHVGDVTTVCEPEGRWQQTVYAEFRLHNRENYARNDEGSGVPIARTLPPPPQFYRKAVDVLAIDMGDFLLDRKAGGGANRGRQKTGGFLRTVPHTKHIWEVKAFSIIADQTRDMCPLCRGKGQVAVASPTHDTGMQQSHNFVAGSNAR